MTAAPVADLAAEPTETATLGELVVHASSVTRRFGTTAALDGASLLLERCTIHALVGPNGAGKTTLLRVLTGAVDADGGTLRVLGLDPARSPMELRKRIAVVPSGTRSFYLRISGLENLLFFARLHGFRRRAALPRVWSALEAVGLSDAARNPVSTYSTGMQRRLAVARATLHEPELLLIDEATHDLDPSASAQVRDLVKSTVAGGASVLWATQRLEEIRGFADKVTLLQAGQDRFTGTVPQLLAIALRRRYLVTLDTRAPRTGELHLDGRLVGTIEPAAVQPDGHYLLTVTEGAVLGDCLAALGEEGLAILGCSDAQPALEEAFLAVVERAER